VSGERSESVDPGATRARIDDDELRVPDPVEREGGLDTGEDPGTQAEPHRPGGVKLGDVGHGHRAVEEHPRGPVVERDEVGAGVGEHTDPLAGLSLDGPFRLDEPG
jgi:hypothetical protein